MNIKITFKVYNSVFLVYYKSVQPPAPIPEYFNYPQKKPHPP